MANSSRNESLVLMYHGLDPGDGRYDRIRPWVMAYILKAEIFEAHLEALGSAGRRIVRPEPGALPLGPGQALLTFDDGMQSDCDVALPILKKKDLKALFFVTTQRIGFEDYMSETALGQLAEAGMAVGAHGHTHRLLSELSLDEQKEELQTAATILKERTGATPWALSLPGGRYNRDTLTAAQATGYRAVFTSEPVATRQVQGLLLVGRLALRQGFDAQRMRNFLADQKTELAAIRRGQKKRDLLRRLLGDRMYDGLHQAYWKGRQ